MRASAADRRLALPRPILIFLILSAALTGISAIRFWHLFIVQPEHFRYPGWGYFYYWPIARIPLFPDIICFTRRFSFLHTPAFFSSDPRLIGIEPPFEYPAAATFLYYIPYAIRGESCGAPNYLIAFLAFVVLTIIALACVLGRALVKAGLKSSATVGALVIAVLISYPFWFEFGTANVEFYIFLLLLAGTWAFCTGRSNLAAIFYGAAGGMKIFPIIFVGLFLARRQWKPIAIALGVALLLNLAGLRLISPSISFASRGISAGLAFNRKVYILQVLRLETSFDHSLFGFLKRIAAATDHWILPDRLLTAYMILVAGTGLFLYFSRIRKLPTLNQIVALYIVAILFPPTSHDYTLIHLYVPWALLFLYLLHTKRAALPTPRGMTLAFVCLAFACSSENELTLGRMGFSAQVKCVALVVLFLVVLTQRWPWSAIDTAVDSMTTS